MFNNLDEYKDYFRKGFRRIKSISVRTMPEALSGFFPRYDTPFVQLIREANAHNELFHSPKVAFNSYSYLVIKVIGKNKYKILYFEYSPYEEDKPNITDESQSEYVIIATLIKPETEVFRFDFYSEEYKESFLGYCYFKGLLHTVNEFEDFTYIHD